MSKINIIILLIIMIMTSFHTFAEDHNNKDSNQVPLQAGYLDPNGFLMKVDVEGLVCDFCAKAIEKVFMKREEVVGIAVDLAKQNVIIALKENMNIEDYEIEELFLNAGYNITQINRKKL